LQEDGKVSAIGCNDSRECETSSWSRVIQIAVAEGITLGLQADGTVLATGRHSGSLRSLRGVRSLACFGDWQIFLMMDGSLWVHACDSDFLPTKLQNVRLFTMAPGHSLLSRWIGTGAGAAMERTVAHQIRRSFGCGLSHAVRLLPDGHVAVRGANDCGQCNTSSWTGVTALSCGLNHTGAIANGQVRLTGWDAGVKRQEEALNSQLIQRLEAVHQNIPAGADHFTDVACGYEHTAVLRGDGRVFAIGVNPDGRCDTYKWRNVVDIACGVRHTAAVTATGQCVATGDNRQGQCRVDGWSDVVMVACGEYHTVGLCADGHVVAVGGNSLGQCRVDDLRDIISIGCLPEATLCVHADGHVTVRGGDQNLVKAASELQGVVAIDGKEYRLCALTVDRQLMTNRIPPKENTARLQVVDLS
jgi:alpha-tubulin suppressor-like RCC1 family protein